VFVTWLIEPFGLPTRSRSWLTSSGVAFHLAAPPCEEPVKSTRLRGPKARWSFDPTGLLKTPIRRLKLPAKTARCSAALLGITSTASRFAHQSSEEPREPRRATGRYLFRRLFPADPDQNSKVLLIACRRRSDLWSPAAPFLPLPTLRGGRDRRPDHKLTMHPRSESGKRKMREKACG